MITNMEFQLNKILKRKQLKLKKSIKIKINAFELNQADGTNLSTRVPPYKTKQIYDLSILKFITK